MSDSQNDRKDFAVGDPEGEWDAVVRRLSERIRRRSKGAPTTQTSLDLAGELVRLERRAREAEAVLEREREAFALRVREMEDKLRKLDPWLRQLKAEYQKAASERDRLRDELEEARKDAPPPPSAADLSKTAVIEADRLAALREAEAAHAARQAAVAEAESLKKRIENEKANVDSSANERIAEAEKSRDAAIEDARQLRKALAESRRAEDEVRRLARELEALETTTAAHKAVARAAQDSLEAAQARVAEMETAERARSQGADQAARRVTELTAEVDRAKAETVAAQRKLAGVEKVAEEFRGGEADLRRELAEKTEALEAARAELGAAAHDLERRQAEATDAMSQAERTRGESVQARDELAQARRDAANAAAEAARAQAALEAANAEGEQDRAAAGAAQRDAAESKELAEEAMRSEGEARRRAEELAAKFASAAEEIAAASARARAAEAASQDATARLAAERSAREDADRRAAELDARAADAEARAHDLASEAELAKGRVRVLESDAANLNRTLEDERQGAVARFEAAEASWRSQMRAAESRFDADIHHEREHAREVEEVLKVFEARHGRAVAEHDTELTRIRTAAMQFVTQRTQDLVAGIHRIVGDEPVVVPPITMSMDADANQRTPTATVVVAPLSSVVVPPPVTGEWDRLMSGVEQLWSEVEGIRQENALDDGKDTDSMPVEDSAAAVAAARASDTASVETTSPPASVEPATVDVDDPRTSVSAESSNGKRRKKRR